MTHSYKDQVTAEHDAFCISAALASALENNADRANYSVTLEAALEEAYVYLAEGLSNCRCMFAGLTGEARIAYLLQFSDSALVSMVHGGYHNDSTGELMQINLDDYSAVQLSRSERESHWEAEWTANDIVGDQNSYSAVIAADTEAQPAYSLLVNGSKSEHGTYVNKWGIAYAVARELLKLGIDPDNNTGFIAAVLASIEDQSTTASGDTEFSVVTESNN